MSATISHVTISFQPISLLHYLCVGFGTTVFTVYLRQTCEAMAQVPPANQTHLYPWYFWSLSLETHSLEGAGKELRSEQGVQKGGEETGTLRPELQDGCSELRIYTVCCHYWSFLWVVQKLHCNAATWSTHDRLNMLLLYRNTPKSLSIKLTTVFFNHFKEGQAF